MRSFFFLERKMILNVSLPFRSHCNISNFKDMPFHVNYFPPANLLAIVLHTVGLLANGSLFSTPLIVCTSLFAVYSSSAVAIPQSHLDAQSCGYSQPCQILLDSSTL
jgi:hypothetical protein